MLWAGPLVLTLLTSATPAPVASTYDQAACAAAQEGEASAPLRDGAEEDAGGDCEQPAPPPAIIDCNDPGMSAWVADMIGSCDMPKPVTPFVVPPTAVRGTRDDGGPGGQRLCDGLHCSHDSYPVRAAASGGSDGSAIVLSRVEFRHQVVASPLARDREAEPDEAPRSRLERPPRV